MPAAARVHHCRTGTVRVLCVTKYSPRRAIVSSWCGVSMTTWLRRLRGAVGMGVTWAAAWAVTGVLIGVTSVLLPGLPWNAFFDVFDAPLPALAIPGFVGGAIFSLVLGVVGRRRRF